MKSRTLTGITAMTLFAALAIPLGLAAQGEPPAPNQDEQPLQVGGTGTTNFIPIWSNSTTLGNSALFQTGGLVGIGTTSPTAALTVLGPNGIGFASAPTVLQVTGGTAGGGITAQGGGIVLAGGLGGNNGALNSGGPITITGGNGSATNPSSGGAIKLTGGHGGNPSSPGVIGGRGGSITIAGGDGGESNGTKSGPGGSVTLQAGAAFLGGTPGDVILTGGKVGIGTTTPANTLEVVAGGTTLADAWTTRSSLRFKTNIHTLNGALETVERLRGVSYDSQASGKHEIGVIAEEVGRVVPEVVSYEKNGVDAQGVDYSRLTALLIEAVKSQEAKIQQLSAQVEQLKLNSAGH